MICSAFAFQEFFDWLAQRRQIWAGHSSKLRLSVPYHKGNDALWWAKQWIATLQFPVVAAPLPKVFLSAYACVVSVCIV
jgi:hypothetical protein